MRRPLSAGSPAFIVSLIAGFAVCLQSFATDPSPISVDLHPYLGRLRTVDVRIGNQTLPFLFDTAGGLTIITPEIAKSIGCEPYGRLVVHRMDGEAVSFQTCGEQTLSISGEKFTRELSVMDLMALLPEGAPMLGGILSLHTFQDRILCIELANHRITIETLASAKKKQAGTRPLRMRLARQAGGASLDAFLEVQAGKESLWLELDSSNLDDVLLAPHAWKLLSLSSPEKVKEAQNIELQVSGLPPEKITARLKNLIYDGALNQEWLSRYELTIDLISNQMWARRVSSASRKTSLVVEKEVTKISGLSAIVDVRLRESGLPRPEWRHFCVVSKSVLVEKETLQSASR